MQAGSCQPYVPGQDKRHTLLTEPQYVNPDTGAFFPLTRENFATNMPLLYQQFFSCRVMDLAKMRELVARVYTQDAQFEWPLLRVKGRKDVIRVWTAFLLAQGLQRMDVHRIRVSGLLFDSRSLQATVHIEAWQRYSWLAWLEGLLGVPIWKVFVTQLLQLQEDSNGHLRISYMEDLIDQHIFLGSIMGGVYSTRADPGTLIQKWVDTYKTICTWMLLNMMVVLEHFLNVLGVAV